MSNKWYPSNSIKLEKHNIIISCLENICNTH